MISSIIYACVRHQRISAYQRNFIRDAQTRAAINEEYPAETGGLPPYSAISPVPMAYHHTTAHNTAMSHHHTAHNAAMAHHNNITNMNMMSSGAMGGMGMGMSGAGATSGGMGPGM